ncbi:MAG: transporter permease [Acidimicrobiales bacterium]|nr:transporter permease [Acidimicrobiales bacterium]
MIALLRTEFVKAIWRPRTLVIAFFLIGLPFLVIANFGDGPPRPRDVGDDIGTYRLAHISGLLAAPALLRRLAEFLLIVIAGLYAGDSVAGDAAWGNLRYLLIRPIGRLRLLLAKTFVAATMIFACVFLVTGAAALAGWIKFGVAHISVPNVPAALNAGLEIPAFEMSIPDQIGRIALSAGYVSFGFLALLGLGIFFSTIADSPTGAIGGAIGVYIVSQILDEIEPLGSIRYILPTHYGEAWRPMLTEHRFTTEMALGLLVQLCWFVAAYAAASFWFRRKDIHS